ncbi:hypothetical protein HDF12_003971 [Edaphobacter lichenicola]|uniref:UvrD-like helicase C-terminal domain-containing protein n=1 Tax=Tunturiibacter lichenicola TaxID=2051959 RepID=A0A7Y9NQK5_9BACT|nr:hypothetical protein [Edaphobacter lichenicola]
MKRDGKSDRLIFVPQTLSSSTSAYAVTSHSSHGLTAGRVLVKIDIEFSSYLVNERLASVAISQASHSAKIWTNNTETLLRPSAEIQFVDLVAR